MHSSKTGRSARVCSLEKSQLILLQTIHSPLFFRFVVRIERLTVWTAILVSYVPRGLASGFKAVGGGRYFWLLSKMAAPNAKRSIWTILGKNGGL